MPSGVLYSPMASGAYTDDQILASIHDLLVAYATTLSISMPSGLQYSPMNMWPPYTSNQYLAAIQNVLVAINSGVSGSTVSGTVNLTSGQQDGYTATFSTAFASPPKLAFGFIKSGTGSGNIFVAAYSVTTTGFTFDLSGNPGTGATLNYIAVT